MSHLSRHTCPEDFRRVKKEIDLLPMYLMLERTGQGCPSMHTHDRVLHFALRSQSLDLLQTEYLTD